MGSYAPSGYSYVMGQETDNDPAFINVRFHQDAADYLLNETDPQINNQIDALLMERYERFKTRSPRAAQDNKYWEWSREDLIKEVRSRELSIIKPNHYLQNISNR